LSLEFFEGARNVVLVAAGGLGKTMIAQNIAHRAILAGHSVLFVAAAHLLLDLAAQESARALDRRLRFYANVGLLVLDEMGYLAFDNRNADLLFQVVSRRYEKESRVMATNLAFKEWHTIFPPATCAHALIERVVHRRRMGAPHGMERRRLGGKLGAPHGMERRRLGGKSAVGSANGRSPWNGAPPSRRQDHRSPWNGAPPSRGQARRLHQEWSAAVSAASSASP
jgi:hypothetical protein